jgi:hypothetical protein
MANSELSQANILIPEYSDEELEKLVDLLKGDPEAFLTLLPPEELEAYKVCQQSIVVARSHAANNEGWLYIA